MVQSVSRSKWLSDEIWSYRFEFLVCFNISIFVFMVCECLFRFDAGQNLNFFQHSIHDNNDDEKKNRNTKWQQWPLKTWFSIHIAVIRTLINHTNILTQFRFVFELSVKPEKSDRNDNSNCNCNSNSAQNSK